MVKIINLDEFLLEGMDSGEAIEVTPAFWEKKYQQLKRDIARILKDKVF